MNRWGHLWSVRLGMVHIPKCAGQSLGLAIHEAWGLRYRSVNLKPFGSGGSALNAFPFTYRGPQIPPEELSQPTKSPRLVQRFGPELYDVRANEELLDISFLTGHISPTLMRMLGRTSLLTVLRNPYDRAMSEYAFSHRVAREGHAPTPPPLFDYLSINQNLMTRTIFGFSGSEYLSDEMWETLFPSSQGEHSSHPPFLNLDKWKQAIRQILGEFDFVFTGMAPNKVLDELYRNGFLPRPWTAKTVNAVESPVSEFIPDDELAAQLEANFALDLVLYTEAMALFPHLVCDQELPSARATAKKSSRWVNV